MKDIKNYIPVVHQKKKNGCSLGLEVSLVHERHNFFLFVFCFCFFSKYIVDKQGYISFNGTTCRWTSPWSMLGSRCVQPRSVTIKCYYNVIDSSPCAVPFISVTYSFHNWKPTPPTPLRPFYPPPSTFDSFQTLTNFQLVLCIYGSIAFF